MEDFKKILAAGTQAAMIALLDPPANYGKSPKALLRLQWFNKTPSTKEARDPTLSTDKLERDSESYPEGMIVFCIAVDSTTYGMLLQKRADFLRLAEKGIAFYPTLDFVTMIRSSAGNKTAVRDTLRIFTAHNQKLGLNYYPVSGHRGF